MRRLKISSPALRPAFMPMRSGTGTRGTSPATRYCLLLAPMLVPLWWPTPGRAGIPVQGARAPTATARVTATAAALATLGRAEPAAMGEAAAMAVEAVEVTVAVA